MGTSVIFFASVNFIKIVPYAILGMLAPSNLLTSAVLLLLAPLGVYIGVWMNRNVSNELFYRIIYTAIFCVGAGLYWEVFAG